MKRFLLYFAIFFLSCNSDDTTKNALIIDAMYFPPNTSNIWETKSVTDMGWNQNKVQPLLDYITSKNTKGFIILHNGKIIIEHYANGHSATTPWYWASAGKTLTTAVTGIAEQEGFLNTNKKVSDYLGNGWTNSALAKENLIICTNLLTMTSGLDDSAGDNVSPSNLNYVADAGSRWAYHNVYVKLQDVVANATNQTFENYFTSKLKNPIGMSGQWITSGNNEVYWSNTRSMARFGLLSLNKGNWDGTQVLNETYFNKAVSTSQNINLAYGYLWWLNGKTSFHLPATQAVFQGKLIPNAPDDMYAALGKNDQKIYVIPSKKLVIIRMGEAADPANTTFGLSGFDNVLWEKINDLIN